VDHALRRERLAERIVELEVDALLVTRLPNVRYLTGFTGSNGQLLLGAAGTVFFTDGRYTEQSRREVPDLERVTSRRLAEPLLERCRALGVARLAFEAEDLTVASHEDLAAKLAGVELVGSRGVVEGLRWTKDLEEVELLRAAQRATDEAFDDVVERIAVGMTERQVASELEQALRRHGADGLAFDPIVAFGEQAAEPHHAPGHRILDEGDVIKLDFGAVVAGYHADMTRTVSFGSPATELRKIHDLVREAQQAGIDAVRAGARGADVVAVARDVIGRAGYGDRFTHGLGHGVGLEIHEGPGLASTTEDVLPEGSVVTVEPGVYVPGLGGVRIEDMVWVTDGGCEVLGVSTRELIEL
jgi:Xaa-Pro aminopeptidase